MWGFLGVFFLDEDEKEENDFIITEAGNDSRADIFISCNISTTTRVLV